MLTIIADIYADRAHAGLVRSELEKLIAPTLAERGCLQYDLHQDNEDPAHFLFYENWETRELWQEHMRAPHLVAFQAAVDGAISDTKIFEMARVG